MMPKVLRYILYVLFGVETLLCLLFAVCLALPHYEVTLVHPLVFSVLRFAVSCATAVLFCRFPAVFSKKEQLFSLFLMLTSYMNSCIFLFKSNLWAVSFPVLGCMLLDALIFWKCTKGGRRRGIAVLLCGLAVVFVPIYCLFQFVIFNLSVDTVVQKSVSPQGNYVAEVIENSQGALGGETYVTVRGAKSLHFLLFTVHPEANCVYQGDYGEAEVLDLQWNGEEILLIDGQPYSDF